MAEVTVKQLAQVVNTPVEKLLEQLREAGVAKTSEEDSISDDEKGKLLSHLQTARGSGPTGLSGPKGKITLRRKRVNEIKTDASGRKTVNVEVRTKRVVKRPAADAPVADTKAPPAVGETESSAPPAPATAEADVEVTTDSAKAAPEAPNAEEMAKVSADLERSVKESAAAAASAPREETPQEPPAAEVESIVAVTPTPAEPEPLTPEDEIRAQAARDDLRRKEQEAAEQTRQRMSLVEQQLAKDHARIAAEHQAEKQAAQEKKRVTEETARKAQEERVRQQGLEEAQRRASIEAQEVSKEKSNRKESGGRSRGKGKSGGADTGGTRYGRNQLHVAKDKSGRRRGKARRAAPANIESKHGFEKPTAPVIRDITVPETVTVADLANKMAVKAGEVIKTMMGMGVMATINQMLDQDTAILVVEEMGHTAKPIGQDDI